MKSLIFVSILFSQLAFAGGSQVGNGATPDRAQTVVDVSHRLVKRLLAYRATQPGSEVLQPLEWDLKELNAAVNLTAMEFLDVDSIDCHGKPALVCGDRESQKIQIAAQSFGKLSQNEYRVVVSLQLLEAYLHVLGKEAQAEILLNAYLLTCSEE